MAVTNLVAKYSPIVDERFFTESKSGLVTNQNFSWVGARTVKVYSVGVAAMNDYGRNTSGTSRYGTVGDLDAVEQELTLAKDRSFTFAIDKMDEDETLGALNAGSALARQIREVVMPEIDAYTFLKMAANAGNSVTGTFTSTSAYEDIITATEVLDDAEVPAEGRVLLVTSKSFKEIKKSSDIVLETEIGQDLRIRGVVANLDGMLVQKLPSKYFPAGLNFMVAHPIATPRPIKLAEYKIHNEPQGVSGALVEGRVYYDAFVLDNKADAIYTHFISGYSA
jgi:hypothetical protein